MTFFKVHKSLWDGQYGFQSTNLHQMDEFLHVRTHTWKNSSRDRNLKNRILGKIQIFMCSLLHNWDELFGRTHT